MNSVLRPFCIASLIAGSALVASAEIERTVEKSFPVTAAGTIMLSTQGGSIRVSPSADTAVKITARQRIRAADDAEAGELLKKLELTFEQTGNDVRAVARYENRPTGFRFGSWPPVSVDFIVTVPAAFAAELRTSGGSITVGDLDGRLKAETSGGPITLGRIGGETRARTSGGNIKADEIRARATLETSGGDITVGTVAGPATLATSGGGIRVAAVGEALNARTSGGSIRAAFVGPLRGDSSLSTSGGSIRVTLAKDAAFRLDASSNGGGVDADGLTIKLEGDGSRRSKLAGNVNGGGPVLKLRASGGGVTVRAE